jgi:predicted kinase/2'-5' RNA ligase
METIHRIIHDPALPTRAFTFGYLDRFLGIIERSVASANWSDITTLDLKKTMAVPKHRIQYIKCNNEIVWDKRSDSRVDTFWNGAGINEILKDQMKRGLWSMEIHANLLQRNTTISSIPTTLSSLSSSDEINKTAKKSIYVNLHANCSNELRPNYFVCLRISDDDGRRIVHDVQRRLTRSATKSGVTGLVEGCLPLRALHVTLTTLHCETKADLQAAATVIATHTLDVALETANVEFDSVNAFRDRVFHAVPSASSTRDLTHLSQSIENNLRALGRRGVVVEPCAVSTEERRAFIPHMTICKISRLMQRRGISKISKEWYLGLATECQFIAKNAMSDIFLCRMEKPTADDGFFKIVSQGHGVVVAEQEDRKEDQKEDQKEELSNPPTSTPSTPTPLVVILRGVPGSGKSTTCERALSLLSSKRPTFSHIVCSADHYFEHTDQSSGVVHYNFIRSRIKNAHKECQQIFDRAVRLDYSCVVVDNTNIRKWNYKHYLDTAKRCGCRVVILSMNTQQAPNQNNHQVPKSIVERMLRQWEKDDINGEICIESTRDNVATQSMYHAISNHLLQPKVQGSYTPLRSNSSGSNNGSYNGGSSLRQRSALRQRSLEAAEASSLRIKKNGKQQFQKTKRIPPANRHELSDEGKRLLLGRTSKETATIIYVGGFLTSLSKDRILANFHTIHENIVCDHVTLCYRPSQLEWDKNLKHMIGKTVMFHGMDVPNDQRCQALRIKNIEQIWYPTGQQHHVTLSLSSGVPASEAHELTKRTPVPPFTENEGNGFSIETIVGVRLKVDGRRRPIIVHDPTKLLDYKLTFTVDKEETKQEHVNVNRKTTVSPIENILVYDFDDTLFMTPHVSTWEEATNRTWQNTSWVRDARSLSGLMFDCIKAGPSFSSLHERRHLLSKESTFCCVLTGRPRAMEKYVKDVLQQHGILSLFDRIVCIPDRFSKSTASFKAQYVKLLLEEHSNTCSLEVFDDDDRNLIAVQKMLEGTHNRRDRKINTTLHHVVPQKPCPLVNILREQNLLATDYFRARQKEILADICKVWSRVIASVGVIVSDDYEDVMNLIFPFGSYTYGRRSDIDLVLVGPRSMTAIMFIEKMSTSLFEAGFCYHSNGDEGRLTMIQCMRDDIEVDIIFSPISSSEIVGLTSKKISPVDFLLSKALSNQDGKIKEAFSGPRTSFHVAKRLQKLLGTHDFYRFSVLITGIIQIQKMYDVHGNYFLQLRTFQLVEIILKWLEHEKITNATGISCLQNEKTSLSTVFVQALDYLGRCLTTELLGQTKRQDTEDTEACRQAFLACSASLLCSISDENIWANLFHRKSTRRPYGTILVTMTPRISTAQGIFHFKATLRHAVPPIVRHLKDVGVAIFPCRVDRDLDNDQSVQFAVPRGRAVRDALRDALGDVQRTSKYIAVAVTITAKWQQKSSVDALTMLRECVEQQQQQHELWFPCTFTTKERAHIHATAESFGMSSRSEGESPFRSAVVVATVNDEYDHQRQQKSSMLPFFKFPRTQHLLNLGGTGVTRDDLVMNIQDSHSFLNVQNTHIDEKIDGAKCVSIL